MAFARYTAPEIERAITLKETGLTWAEVGIQLNRTAGSLMVTVSLYRRGLRKTEVTEAERHAVDAKLAEAVLNHGALSAKAAARFAGIDEGRAYYRLTRMGLDAAARRAAVREARAA